MTSSFLLAYHSRFPNAGPLAVLWWATMISALGVAGFYMIRRALAAKGPDGVPLEGTYVEPTTFKVSAAFLIVMAITIAVLVASRVIPET
jgi:hypothetical protein